MKKIIMLSKYDDWDLFETLVSFNLYEKFADDTQETIYLTSEQITIANIIHEIGRIKKKLNIE